MAAVIGSRLLHHVLPTIPATALYLWSDSQIVLHWLSSYRKLKTFEQKRVSEIHKLTENRKWMYCPNDHNPADLLTRGIKAEEFTKNRLWDKGPDWLTNKNNYPIQPLAMSTMLLTDVGEKDVGTFETLVTKTDGIHNLIDIDRFSRYRKLHRVTAYVMRFIQNCRPSTISDKTVTLSVKELTLNRCGSVPAKQPPTEPKAHVSRMEREICRLLDNYNFFMTTMVIFAVVAGFMTPHYPSRLDSLFCT